MYSPESIYIYTYIHKRGLIISLDIYIYVYMYYMYILKTWDLPSTNDCFIDNNNFQAI